MQSILIVDDDKDICTLVSNFLGKKGFSVTVAHNGDDAVSKLKNEEFALVLCDYRLPDTNGVEMIQRVRLIQPGAAIVIITGYSDVKTAVDTFKHGADDYVVKPLYPDEILMTIKEAISKKEEAKRSTQTNKKTLNSQVEVVYVDGASPQAETVKKHIALVAPSDMSVIISGETGTGKEYVAKAIHQKSNRQGKSFVALDCGALPNELAGSELFGHVKGAFTGAVTDKTGTFELADSGTLFLDEIGNLSYENQVKLLRVLQERCIRRIGGTKVVPIDVRIVVATNEDLTEAVKEGKFREDLYHRLNEFKIELSPLRQRKEDIMLFAKHFLDKANKSLNKNVKSFSKEVEGHLNEYHWYGNLRELNNVVKRAVLLCSGTEIEKDHLPGEILNSSPHVSVSQGNIGVNHSADNILKAVTGNAERQAIIDVLEKTGFNKSKAAEVLKIDRKTLYNKLKAYDIKL
ncbi:MAG: sigma-54-dependent transcriptional regulator [Cyclobacteriaceae bacterium]